MKKIGILFGQENTFPQAFVDRVNQKAVEGITAEFVKVDEVEQFVPTEYAVIIDRISQDVPFYRAYLKNAALTGTAVINNPFCGVPTRNFSTTPWPCNSACRCPRPCYSPASTAPTTPTKTHSATWACSIGKRRLSTLVFRPL